jgi:hypothetical protein
MKLAVLAYHYLPSASPTTLGIVSYLAERFGACDLITDYAENLPADGVIALPREGASAPVCARPFRSLAPVRRWLRRREERARQAAARKRLAEVVGGYDLVIAGEFFSLHLLDAVGFPLERVAYLSLESTQVIELYDAASARRRLQGCRLHLIQNEDRGRELNEALGLDLPFAYLPVSMRPPPEAARETADAGAGDDAVRIVHSGYICDWSGVAEFVAGLDGAGLLGRHPLTVQGHALGTEEYRDRLVERYGERDGVTFDLSYYEERDHRRMLARHDAGLALYLPHADVPNWRNLITSSGKIAAYAWAGLAILTNLADPRTLEPPFVRLADFEPATVAAALARVAAERETHREAALALARRDYNLDAAMDAILGTLLPQDS